MDRLENWVTWLLMVALVYKVDQIESQNAACGGTQTAWGVTDLLNSGQAGSVVSGLGRARSLGDCGCGGTCGGC